MGKVSNEVRQRYEAKVYDKILLRLRKETETDKDTIQAAADAAGESLNGYIIRAIKERMERDKEK